MTVGQGEFSAFVAATRPSLRRTALFLTGEHYAADDLVQETLIAVYRRWDQLDAQSAASGYARHAMVRIFISDRRHAHWRRESLRAPSDLPDRPAEATTRDPDPLLNRVLAAVPPRQRATLVLRYYYDRSVTDTAMMLGCTPATVRSQTTRALRTARKVLSWTRDPSNVNSDDCSARLPTRPFPIRS
jgi:RNA polymerase sigma-70 factor (sigma-E family)